MAIDFPNNPANGDTYTVNGKTWQWDGSVWAAYGNYLDPGTLNVDKSNGRVGINNTNPTVALDVTGAAAISSDLTVGGTAYVDTANGRVGIGTASPVAPLHLYHPTVNFPLVLESGDATAGIAFADSDSTGGYYNRTIQAVGDDIRINAGGSSRLTVASSGNVGINDTTPSYKLDVNGDGRFTGSFYLTGIASVPVGEWQSYTPGVSTSSSVGNGSTTGYYMRVGNIIHAYARFDLGSTSTWDNRFGRISAPVTAKNSGSTSTQDNANIIQVEVNDASASLTYIMGGFIYDTGQNFRISGWRAIDATAGSGIRSGYFLDLSNDVTLADGDSITIKAIYMADD